MVASDFYVWERGGKVDDESKSKQLKAVKHLEPSTREDVNEIIVS